MEKGKRNLADYFIKHHPKRHRAQIRSIYLFDPANLKRNYFEVLAEDDLKDQTCRSPLSTTSSFRLLCVYAGEGVLFLLVPGVINP
jgi:ABC-type tungstate transport system permease subunit